MTEYSTLRDLFALGSSAVAVEEPVPAEPPICFRDVFEAEFGYVWNTLRRLGVREADLKDVAQEVFLTVHQILADYDRSRPLRPWLFGIAYRYAARYRALARHKREIFAEPAEVPPDPTSAEELLSAAQDRALVLRAIERIALPRRAVFVMVEIDGFSIPEVAATIGIPLNTAYSRLRFARQEFMAAVARLQRQEARP